MISPFQVVKGEPWFKDWIYEQTEGCSSGQDDSISGHWKTTLWNYRNCLKRNKMVIVLMTQIWPLALQILQKNPKTSVYVTIKQMQFLQMQFWGARQWETVTYMTNWSLRIVFFSVCSHDVEGCNCQKPLLILILKGLTVVFDVPSVPVLFCTKTIFPLPTTTLLCS